MAEEAVSKRGRPVGTRTSTVELATLSFKVPVELKARLQAYAKQRRHSISELIREGVEWRLGEGDPLHIRYGTAASGETGISGDGEEKLRGLVLDLFAEVRRYREEVRVSAQRSGVTQDATASSVTGNTGSVSTDGDIPVAGIKAQRRLGQAPAEEDMQESIPPYDRAKHHLGKLCPGKHEWGTTGQSLRNTDNQCLTCKAQAKREKRQAKRQAQPVAG